MRKTLLPSLLALLLAACGSPASAATQVRAADGMVMIRVPAGEFLRGSTQRQIEEALAKCVPALDQPHCEEWLQHETPQRTIYLDTFWIDRTEVTNAQYRMCVQAGRCDVPGLWDNGQYNADDQPVVGVTWDQARTYCLWALARLPTEAEWEKAARGTDGRIFPWGDQEPTCDRTNYGKCTDRPAAAGTHPGGASPYGAQDMAGNVMEWVNDWFDPGYYAVSPDRNPEGALGGIRRVQRDGSFRGSREWIRSSHRYSWLPADRFDVLGFRCAQSTAPSP